MKRLFPDRIEEVEEANVVWAGIRAVARTDAAVVHLSVQSLFGVVARVRRAHRLAWCGITLLAEDRSELQSRIGEFAFPITLDANPMHGAAARGLRCAHRRNVVLRSAGRHARFTPRATVQVHSHAPSSCHRTPSFGRSRISPANRISSPVASCTRAMRTRVAAHARAPVAGSVSAASSLIGFWPRPLA